MYDVRKKGLREVSMSSFGVSLKPQHYEVVLETLHPVDFFEVHSENYMVEGGSSLKYLECIRESYELSLHGVSLSLGSWESPNKNHLKALKKLMDRVNPFLVSEHISWSRWDKVYLNDLLPLPYTQESLDTLCRNISITQDFLGRKILVENPSTYLAFKEGDFSESQFINALVQRTGCGLLLDVNNIYVSGTNNCFNPSQYIEHLSPGIVEEFHLAGHKCIEAEEGDFLIDTHGTFVCDAVWNLYGEALEKFGNVSTLVEWDADVPDFSVLIQESQKARNSAALVVEQQSHGAKSHTFKGGGSHEAA